MQNQSVNHDNVAPVEVPKDNQLNVALTHQGAEMLVNTLRFVSEELKHPVGFAERKELRGQLATAISLLVD